LFALRPFLDPEHASGEDGVAFLHLKLDNITLSLDKKCGKVSPRG